MQSHLRVAFSKQFQQPLKFVAISDTHCRHLNLKLPKADVLIHAGDVSYLGKKSEVVDFLNWFSNLDYPYKIFIAGNHDFYFEREKEPERIIPDNIIYLNDSGTTIGGIHIWGSPITPWFFNWAFNRHPGLIGKHWSQIPPDTDLLITHGPAFGILDTVINGRHVGDKELLRKLKDIRPRVHVCGHIHESYGQIKKGDTYHINASILNEMYEPVNKPVVFELAPGMKV